MDYMEWFFNGLGTTILSLIVGALGGGMIGYKIGVKQTAKQNQIAGNDSNQRQELQLTDQSKIGNEASSVRNHMNQSQKAGDNTKQTQIGGINNGRK